MAQPEKPSRRNGLRVTVRLHGTVVGQAVHWASRRKIVAVGLHPDAAIPTTSGGPLVEGKWLAADRIRLHPVEPGTVAATVAPGSPWRWDNGSGVEVDLDVVPLIRARRFGAVGGDLALLTLMLTLSVAVHQGRELWMWVMPQASYAGTYEPTPELIARLLENDLDGAEEGIEERVERVDVGDGQKSFYMPAGNEGPKLTIRGGEQAGDEIRRAEPEDDEPDPILADADTPGEDPLELDGAREPNSDDGLADAGLPGTEDLDQATPDDTVADGPLERFVGWGFRDWMDSHDDRDSLPPDMARQLDFARRRLRIDPDDPAAIQVVGYYAYLAEKTDLCRDAYERYTTALPDDPAGWNNLALTYKRTGEYQEEEALYRKALSLDPFDEHVLNNLAVNLAHQGRFDEALRLMDQLEEISPDDPYADLHRAKILALMGKEERAYRVLRQALEGVSSLDTLHHIEFRQDIRVDPAFETMRKQRRFRHLLQRYYGDEAEFLVSGPDGRSPLGKGGRRG